MSAWGVLFGTFYALINRSRVATAVTLALVVVTHWVLDVLVHRPDMPVTVNGPMRLGFGLWNSVPGTLITELLRFTSGNGSLTLRELRDQPMVALLIGCGLRRGEVLASHWSSYKSAKTTW